ncbi:MAG: ammonia channel protein, partial [Bacteroidota bacterium]
NPTINEASGWFYGNPEQLVSQTISIVITILYAVIGTIIIYALCSFITRGVRVDSDTEIEGMDIAYHKETSFSTD